MRLARFASLLALGGAVVAVSACSAILGDYGVGAADPDGGATETGTGTGDGSSPSDAAQHADSESGVDCPSAACLDPSTVKRCDGTSEACAFGCSTTGGAHCAILYPSAPLAPEDLTTAGTTDITISASTRFFTDTGAIENLRAANGDPLKIEVNSGIGFRLAVDAQSRKVAVWTFKSLTVPTGVVVRFDSTNPVAFVATTSIALVGVVDARGYDAAGTLCKDNVAGPGGGIGGGTAAGAGDGKGDGAGHPPNPVGTYAGGASGGSYGGSGGGGGTGGNPATQLGATAAATYGTPDLRPLLGGSGGGAGGTAGGGGGGAVQLVAGEKIVVGGGANPGGVNAGGCNGHGASFGAPGSAAGSGGAILVETPNLSIQANGVLAANGGSGATGGGASDATPGQMSASSVFGSFGSGGYGSGGMAGVGSSPNASAGTKAVNGNGGGGSGGGGVGRIRVNNRSGSFTPPAGAIVTPSFGIAPNPPTSAGSLDVR